MSVSRGEYIYSETMFIQIVFGIERNSRVLEFNDIGFLLVRDVLDRLYTMYDFRSSLLQLYSSDGILLYENMYIEHAWVYRVRRYPVQSGTLKKYFEEGYWEEKTAAGVKKSILNINSIVFHT